MRPQSLSDLLLQLGDEYVPFLPLEMLGLEQSLLDDIFVEDWSFTEPAAGVFRTAARVSVFVGSGGDVALPGAPFLGVSLVDEDQPEFISVEIVVLTQTTPSFAATLQISDLPIALWLANETLVRVALVDGEYTPTGEPFRIESRLLLELNSDLQASVTFPDGLDVPPFAIGDTGLIGEVDSFNFTISEQSPHLSVERVRLILPSDIQPFGVPLPELRFDNVRIGEQGFSGVLNVLWPLEHDNQNPNKPYFYAVEGEPEATLFGLRGGLRSLRVTVENNVLTGSELSGSLVVPYFDEPVSVTVRLQSVAGSLDFLIEVRADGDDTIELRKDELLALYGKRLSIAKTGTTGLISISGGLEPLLWNSDGLSWPRLDVTDLVLEQNLADLQEPPVLRFSEAWLDLKDLATLDLFGFHFELQRIGVGYLQDEDKLWIDLTGSLKLIEQIPLGLGVEGFRITWPRTLHEDLLALFGSNDIDALLAEPEALLALGARIEVRFAGIYIFFGVPQAVEFEGLIRFIKQDQVVGFAGDMSLRLPSTSLALEAGLMVGINFEAPPYPFLYLYFGIQLPSGIPLGQSGLALKGAKGLFGLNVTADRTPEQNPYYDWYKRGPIEGVHPTNKWTHQRWSIALGAGVTITTTDGKILGIQGLLALIIPGPIVFIEGKTLIFDGIFPIDGPLKGLGYFDGGAGTVQLNIEAGMELIEDVIDVNANAEAFFDFNDLTNWHLYFGQDVPADRRVRAQFLKLPAIGWLFSGSSYLMIDMTPQLTTNARLGVEILFEPPAFDLEVATAKVAVRIDGQGFLSINPFEFSGVLALAAELEIDAFGLFGISAHANAELRCAGPRPLLVHAELHARVELPIPDLSSVPVAGEFIDDAIAWFEEEVGELPDVPEYLEIDIPFHWQYDGPPQIDALVSQTSLDRALSLSDRSTAAFGMHTVPTDIDEREAAERSPVVALDARPTISFDQMMNQVDTVNAAGLRTSTDTASPTPATVLFHSGEFAFKPTLNDVVLSRAPKKGSGPLDWEVVARINAQPGSTDSLWAFWRNERQLCCWTNSPFDWAINQPPMQLAGASAINTFDAMVRLPVLDPQNPELTHVCIGKQEFAVAQVQQLPDKEQLNVGRVQFSGPSLRVTDSGVLQALSPRRSGPALRIEFSELVSEVHLRVRKRNAIENIVARTRKPARLEVRHDGRYTVRMDTHCSTTVSVSISEDNPVVIRSAAGFRCLEFIGKSILDVTEVCWLSKAALTEAAQHEHLSSTTRALVTSAPPAPMLSADYFYRLQVSTTTEMTGSEHEALLSLLNVVDSSMAQFIDTYQAPVQTDISTWLFQTDGPPRELEQYLKWSSTSDVSLVYPDNDMRLRFRCGYISELFKAPFGVQVVFRDTDGNAISDVTHTWSKALSATESSVERRWREQLLNELGAAPAPVLDDVLDLRLSPGVLQTGQRYTALVTGGEGGRTLIDQRFDGTILDTRWQPSNGTWLNAATLSPGAGGVLRWTDEAGDIDILLRLKWQAGDHMALSVRHPEKQSTSDVFYDIRLHAESASTVRLSIQAASTTHQQRFSVESQLLSGTVDAQILRVRLIDDRLHVRLDTHAPLDITLRKYTTTSPLIGNINLTGISSNTVTTVRPTTVSQPGVLRPQPILPIRQHRTEFDLTRQGKVELRVLHGSPLIQRIRLASPVLLELPFTTSRYRSFSELVGSYKAPTHNNPARRIAIAALDSTHVETAHLAGTRLAEARSAHARAMVDHRDMLLDREALEQTRIRLLDAEAAADTDFTRAVGLQLATLPRPSELQVVPLMNGNQVVALLIDSPESLDLAADVPGAPGRTTVAFARMINGVSNTIATQSIALADSTRLVVYQRSETGFSLFDTGNYQLQFQYIRDHGDSLLNASVFDHRFDRPVHPRQGSTENDQVSVPVIL